MEKQKNMQMLEVWNKNKTAGSTPIYYIPFVLSSLFSAAHNVLSFLTLCSLETLQLFLSPRMTFGLLSISVFVSEHAI